MFSFILLFEVVTARNGVERLYCVPPAVNAADVKVKVELSRILRVPRPWIGA